MAGVDLGFKPMEQFDVTGKYVLLRVDINSPIDPVTKKILNDNRISKSIPTIAWLLERGARLALIAHQGDTLDYQNLIKMEEHADLLSRKLKRPVGYIDDVCGPAAQQRVRDLENGEAVLLGNLRYLCEEISTFENAVKLKPEEMLDTFLIRSLTPLFDLYINDAFAAAHRNAPSMVAFQELLPSAAGPLFFNEISALSRVLKAPEQPAVFVLGGAKISDAFGMIEQVLAAGTADKILACGVTGEVMLIAAGKSLGQATDKFLADRSLDVFIEPARTYLRDYSGRIITPVDLAYLKDGQRVEIDIQDLPLEELFLDIGEKTIRLYENEISSAGTVFVNGPAGVFEQEPLKKGTERLWKAKTP
ncbi:MAG: phosphoglycerate kinase, partial [Spirochaetota bacterium]|nr:phosphoglycerate kinase [Spirochaetota bacterium]